MAYGVVYKIVNITNGKVYVGQTVRTIDKRWKDHIYASKKPSFPIQYAIQKYGHENFHMEILCECSTQEDLNEKERYFAETLNAFTPYGYTCRAGQGRGSISEDVKMKMSKSHKGKKCPNNSERWSGSENPNFGVHARRKEDHPRFGGHISEETRQKMSTSLKGRIITEEARIKSSKTYYFISPNSEQLSITNLNAFCKEHGLSQGGMWDVSAGKQRSYKGWTRDNSKYEELTNNA